MSSERPSPRLFLITPPVADAPRFAPLLSAAVGAADVACVLVRTQTRDDGDAKSIIRALAPIVQAANAAVLIENDARLAARADADGVHMTHDGAALAESITALQPKKIVGCGNIASRDAAMAVGELGVDYLMFGAPAVDHAETIERVGWWAEIFNVPCVGYAGAPQRAREIAEAGAEFVALYEGLWDAPEAIPAVLRAFAEALRTVEAAT